MTAQIETLPACVCDRFANHAYLLLKRKECMMIMKDNRPYLLL
jgi:hypothetical protein